MSKEKSRKLTLVATHEENRSCKAFVQVDGEITEVRWREIVDGLKKLITLYNGFREELISQQKLTTSVASETSDSVTTVTPEKTH